MLLQRLDDEEMNCLHYICKMGNTNLLKLIIERARILSEAFRKRSELLAHSKPEIL